MKSIYRPNRRRGQRVSRRSVPGRRTLQRLEYLFPALLCLLLLGAAGYAAGTAAFPWVKKRLTSSSFFSLREVQVRGARDLTEEEILAAAGIDLGRNVLAMDLEAVRGGLLSHPLVRAAAVRRLLPSEIVVEIEERVPAAEVRGIVRYLVDVEGRVMAVVPGDRPTGLPCLSGLAVDGEGVSPRDMDDLMDGIRIMGIIAAAGFPPPEQVQCVDLGREGDAVIHLRGDGPRIHLGREHVEERLGRWRLVADDISSRWERIEYVDLRADGLVVAKPAPPPPVKGGAEEKG